MADLIDRQAGIDAFVKYVADGYAESPEDFDGYIGIIKTLPSAERTSAWEYIEPEQILQRTSIGGLALLLRYKCKNCGYLSFAESNYCPNCGARMKGDDNG